MSSTSPRRARFVTLLVAGSVVLASCASSNRDASSDSNGGAEPAPADGSSSAERSPTFRYPPAPVSPAADDADAAEVRVALDDLGAQLQVGEIDEEALAELVAAGDPRHAWYVADLMRFFGPGESGNELVDAFESLTGTSLADDPESERSVWLSSTNHLIAWDTPGYPDLRTDKAELFLLVEPRWQPFFDDADSDIDWRYLNWGGVLIDDRELGDAEHVPPGMYPRPGRPGGHRC